MYDIPYEFRAVGFDTFPYGIRSEGKLMQPIIVKQIDGEDTKI